MAYGILFCFAVFGFVLDRVAFAIGGPMWTFRSAIVEKVDTIGSYMQSKSALEERVKELEKKVDEKDASALILKDQLELYKGLDSYIAKKEISKNERVVRVVTRPPQSPFDVLVIDTGDSPVTKGQQMFYAGIPVGVVDSVSGPYARVFLFSHSSSQFRVLVGPKKIEGDAKGKSQGNVSVTLPKSAGVNEGDAVYLAEGSAPFGTVSKIDESSSQSFVDVYITLPFSPSSVDWLTVRKD